MKRIVLLTILVTVGCILAAGCVAQPKKDINATVSPTNTFIPFANSTTIPGSNGTFNASNVTNVTQKLKGPMRVSISGYPAYLPVFIDNQSVGIVYREKPLDLMLDEGNHNVKVCVGAICEQEAVLIVFAKKTFVDFGDRLREKVEFPEPTARIIDYYRDGDGVATVVEFINPTTKDLYMTAEISVGYSFINSRTGQKVGESARGKTYLYVGPGERLTDTIHLYFSDGSAYMFDPPTLLKTTAS
ncbi:MAG: hypothetical protein LUQ36_04135 [Methanoregula sp.]|nr:hypothetical protein [Methanoregula sp.]